MKDYLIWLKGGNCLNGTAEHETLMKMKKAFYDYKDHVRDAPQMWGFNDKDGLTIIDLEEVQAIAINYPCNDKQAGFGRGEINGKR